MLNPVEIIKKKRDGYKLSRSELNSFITGYLLNRIPDYQVSAFLMAIYFNGLDDEEIFELTNIFISSGHTIDLSDIPIPKIDKHSTGGVGDKTSIILAPLLASLGIAVPMMSGRGLGHTGGTLDKLESIPGFRINLSSDEFKGILRKINVCMIGQTEDLVPADKRIYSLRDVTATVECIGLITPSIISKKIAEGSEGIVYDVKVGTGSNLHDLEHSRELAKKLNEVTKLFRRRSVALLTDMNEPLGSTIGNAIEISECIDIMKNNIQSTSSDLIEVTIELAAYMLKIGKISLDLEECRKLAKTNLHNGKCYQKFLQIVELQGGEVNHIENNKYPETKYNYEYKAESSGYINKMSARSFGLASVAIGCGRIKADDTIDHSAGIHIYKKIGDEVNRGDTVYKVFYNDKTKLDNLLSYLENAVSITNNKIEKIQKILEVID